MKKKYDRGLALGTGKSSIKKLTFIETHEEYAAKLYNIPVADVTPEQRKVVKRVRFMELYRDASNEGISDKTGKHEVVIADFAAIETRVQAWAKKTFRSKQDEI